MDLNNPVIKLCIKGTQAEYRGEKQLAKTHYQKAWDTATDDFEACIAAHYIAHIEQDPDRKFYWNQLALEKANSSNDEAVKEFYPSLYLNMGQSYELLGQFDTAKHFYDLAADLGVTHKAE